MKLPRHDTARGTVEELQSLRNSQITPEEAARVQALKYGAIATGIKTIGDVASHIANIKAEEEYTDLVTNYESAYSSIKQGIDDMPQEYDKNKKPIYDMDKIVEMERNARNKIVSDLSADIKSGVARRRFNAYVSETKVQRDEQSYARAAVKETEYIREAATTQVEELVRKGSFPEAALRARAGLDKGALRIGEFNEQMRYIGLSRDINVLSKLDMNPEATQGEMKTYVTSLREGKWDPVLGLENPDIQLGDQHKMQFSRQITNRIAGLDVVNDDELKARQEQNYRDLAKRLRNPKPGQPVTVMDIYSLPPEYMTGGRVNDLVKQIDAGVSYTDNQDTVHQAEGMIMYIRHEVDDMEQALEGFHQWVYSRDDITAKKKSELSDLADNLVNKVFQDPVLKSHLDVAIAGLIDVTRQEQGRGGAVQDNREERVAAADMERDYFQEALKQGSEFDPEKWLNDHAPSYYRDALRASFADMGVLNLDSVLDDSNQLDEDKVMAILEANALNLVGMTEKEIDRLINARWKKVSGLARRMTGGN